MAGIHFVVVISQVQASPGLCITHCPCSLLWSSGWGSAFHLTHSQHCLQPLRVPGSSSFCAGSPLPVLPSSSGYCHWPSSELASPCCPYMGSRISCIRKHRLSRTKTRNTTSRCTCKLLSHEKWRWIEKVEMASPLLSRAGRTFLLAKFNFISFGVIASLNFI